MEEEKRWRRPALNIPELNPLMGYGMPERVQLLLAGLVSEEKLFKLKDMAKTLSQQVKDGAITEEQAGKKLWKEVPLKARLEMVRKNKAGRKRIKEKKNRRKMIQFRVKMGKL